jgi:hypothetical protein
MGARKLEATSPKSPAHAVRSIRVRARFACSSLGSAKVTVNQLELKEASEGTNLVVHALGQPNRLLFVRALSGDDRLEG